MATFNKIIKLVSVDENAIAIAEVTRTQYEYIKNIQKGLKQIDISTTILDSKAITIRELFSYDSEDDDINTVEAVENLGSLISKVESIEVFTSGNILGISFPYKDLAGNVSSTDDIPIVELDIFFFEEELKKAEVLTVDDGPMISSWSESYDSILETSWMDCEEETIINIQKSEISAINSEKGIYVISMLDNEEFDVNLMLLGSINDKPMRIESPEQYCNICCMDSTFDEANNCEACGNHQELEVSEKDEEIQNLAYENKMMAESLKSLGFSQEDIGEICTGTLVPTQTKISIDENKLKAFVLESMFCNGDNRHEDYELFLENAKDSNLVLRQHFKNYPIEWVQEQMKKDLESMKRLLLSLGATEILLMIANYLKEEVKYEKYL